MAILGIDEVGRGPLAGPLVVGACVFKEEASHLIADGGKLAGITDSKKLSEKRREEFATKIPEVAELGLGWVSAHRLDKIGMSAALKEACRAAVSQIRSPFHEIIIDGTVNFLQGTRLEPYTSTLKKADLLVAEVSAAAIMAKVARDHYMKGLTQLYPDYAFERHVGYGTAAHMKALQDFGPCPEHRRSFKPVREIAEQYGEEVELLCANKKKNTSKIGGQAEDVATEFLKTKGHKIVARNWRAKLCEIDIISLYENQIFFTEVKYRRSQDFGGGLAAIDKRKRKQMEYAAQVFLHCNQKHFDQYAPILAAITLSGTDFQVDDFIKIID